MKVKFKRLSNKARIPHKGSAGAAAHDLYSIESVNIPSGQSVFIHTGIAVEIPEGYFGAIYARSGLACKYNIRLANDVAVIDSDYRGEMIVALYNDSDTSFFIEVGDRIAQIVIQPYLNIEFEEVDELDETERGGSGFGSSGR